MKNMKPSVLPSLNEIYDNMKLFGFTRDDLITLIQRRSKISRSDIETTLNSLSLLEAQIISVEDERRKTLLRDLLKLSENPEFKKELRRILIG
jgi:hypothetical protein